MAARVAVVIVSYESSRDIGACLSSLESLHGPTTDVIVVDNASRDGTAALVREQFPWVKLIESSTNLGFAGGNNTGIGVALDSGAEYVYLLNPDAFVDPAFLEEALAVAERDRRVAAIQSLILLSSQRDAVNTAGNEIHFLGFGYCGRFGTERSAVPTEPSEIAYASGAGVLLRAAALRQVGAFDEALFLYHEDLDLGWRLRLAGWRNVLAPRSVVWHRYEFSRNTGKYFYMERNRYLVLGKNLSLRSLALLAPFLLAGELGVLAIAAFAGWLPEKLRANRELLLKRTWEHVRAERARIASLRTVGDRDVTSIFTHRIAFDGVPGGALAALLAPVMRVSWQIVQKVLP